VKPKFSLLIGIVFILSMLLMSTGPVAASDESSVDWSNPVVLQSLYEKVKNAEDPDKSFAELSPEAQEALVESLTKLTYEITVTGDSPGKSARNGLMATLERLANGSMTLGGGTKAVTVTLRAYSWPFHTLIFSFSQRIQWSYDGVYVTAVQDHHSWGEASWPWSYQGLIGEFESGGAGHTYFLRFSQGKFTLNLFGLPVMTMTPAIIMWVYGDGSFSY